MNHSSIKTSEEGRRIYSGGDATELLNAMPARFSHLARGWAERTPDRPALVSGGRSVTYGEFWKAVERAAKLLKDRGVRGGDRVLIVNENSIAAVVLVHACSEIDAWPAAINARMSAREIDLFREFSGCRLAVLTTGDSTSAAAHAERMGAQAIEDPVTGKFAITQTDPSAVPEPVYADKERQTGALIFTSGTTGAPKGVMVSHQSLMYQGGNMVMLRNITQDDVLYNISPISHIIGLGTMLMTSLWAGASFEMMPQFKAEHLATAISEKRITYLLGVPMVYSRLLEYAKTNNISLRPSRLRVAAVAGAPLDLLLKAEVEEALGVGVSNSYGMTEIVPITRSRGPIAEDSVGQVQPGIEIRLVRPDGSDAEVGEPGEVWARGPTRMIGYYKNDAANADVIRTGDFIATGDIARMDQDANLYIVGRQKEVIIRSGFNVYPLEVETVISQFPGVAMNAVFGRAVAGNEEVVAYIQPLAGKTVDEAALREFLRENLAAYKVPSQIYFAELPIGPTGKILKAKLKEMSSGQG